MPVRCSITSALRGPVADPRDDSLVSVFAGRTHACPILAHRCECPIPSRSEGVGDSRCDYEGFTPGRHITFNPSVQDKEA